MGLLPGGYAADMSVGQSACDAAVPSPAFPRAPRSAFVASRRAACGSTTSPGPS